MENDVSLGHFIPESLTFRRGREQSLRVNHAYVKFPGWRRTENHNLMANYSACVYVHSLGNVGDVR
jgi:hypothetical protein